MMNGDPPDEQYNTVIIHLFLFRTCEPRVHTLKFRINLEDVKSIFRLYRMLDLSCHTMVKD